MRKIPFSIVNAAFILQQYLNQQPMINSHDIYYVKQKEKKEGK